MSQTVPGRINSIVNIHNPSIEFHPVGRAINTGAVVILVPGGGHNTLNVGSEGADFVPFFYQYGVNTVILRNRLRRDGYNPQTDAVYDALQAIRMVRAYAKEWNLDPNKIGIMGFSAGAELVGAVGAVCSRSSTGRTATPTIHSPASARVPTSSASSIPARRPSRAIGPPLRFRATCRRRSSRARLGRSHSCALGDRILQRDAGRRRAEHRDAHVRQRAASRRSVAGRQPDVGRADRPRTACPMGTWQYRFIDWFRDLGFLQKPGVETKAARDVAAFANQPR